MNFEFLFQQKEEESFWVQFFKDDGPCEVTGKRQNLGLPTIHEQELVQCRDDRFPTHDVVYLAGKYYTIPKPHEPLDSSVVMVTRKPEILTRTQLID